MCHSDVNGDGVVNFEDYEAVVNKLASAAGVGPGDHFYDETVRYQKEVFQVNYLALHVSAQEGLNKRFALRQKACAQDWQLLFHDHSYGENMRFQNIIWCHIFRDITFDILHYVVHYIHSIIL